MSGLETEEIDATAFCCGGFMSGLETEEIRAPVFACGRHCCFLCLVIAFGDPGQVQGTGPGRRPFLQ